MLDLAWPGRLAMGGPSASAIFLAASTFLSGCSADRSRPLELSTEFFLVPERTPPPAPTLPSVIRTMMNRTIHHPHSSPHGLLRNESWVVPLLVLSVLTMILIAGFEVFVLCKAWRTSPSRRHLFLGQMLLLGLFICATLGAVLAATPTPATCAIVRLGAGVGYALVFAALLVKCVFLISLNGGVYLPAPYQALLLLFAVLIQVAVGVQWLLSTPPGITITSAPDMTGPSAPSLMLSASSPGRRLVLTASDLVTGMNSITLCRTPYPDLLLSLLYVAGLIVLVAVLAVKSRGIRDNYREAMFIGLAVGCAIPIWLVWALCGLVVPERHRDACLAFGLVATSIVVFLVMFMPKGRQLAAMGKEGVYLEDREDRFSSLTPPGSGYSPSFFHFKPVKYGMVSQPQASAQPATIMSGGASKQTSAVTSAQDRVALVAPPPSYTRMYQYYPYCQYPRHPPHPQLIAPCTRPSNVLPIYFDTKSGGVYLKPDDGNLYTTLEPTLSTNPNVYFQRSGVHPGMMY